MYLDGIYAVARIIALMDLYLPLQGAVERELMN